MGFELEWADAIDQIIKYSFKISTPHGSGTGFLMTFIKKANLLAIATAYHVIEHAYLWEDPIKFHHSSSGKQIIIRHTSRFIHSIPERDIAIILLSKNDLPIPEEPLTLAPQGRHLRPGILVGWTGYPFVAPNEYSFFCGSISCALQDQQAYLIDGVAINGVSGGPVFCTIGNQLHLVGVVTAYIPNRATGESLPGVCYAVDVQPFYGFMEGIKSIEEARKRENLKEN